MYDRNAGRQRTPSAGSEETKPFKVAISFPKTADFGSVGSVTWITHLSEKQDIDVRVDEIGTLMVIDPGTVRLMTIAPGYWSVAEVIQQEEKNASSNADEA